MKIPDLHRSGHIPEWETIPPEKWNEHQVRAAQTHGWDTPGNRESLIGFASSLTGFALVNREHHFWGSLFLLHGRWRDLRDGKVAHETGTKSPLGEAIDAGGDGVLAAVAAGVFRRKQIISAHESNILYGMAVVKCATAIIAKKNEVDLHATRSAKVGAFAQWLGMGTQLFARVVKDHGYETGGTILADAGRRLTYTGLALGVTETVGYVKDTFTHSGAVNASARME